MESLKSSADLLSRYQAGERTFHDVCILDERIDGVELDGLSLENAQLKGVDFRGCRLEEVNLVGADLRRSIFREALVLRSDFTRADLSGCRFDEAVLEGTSLRRTLLADARFDGASCRGMDLSLGNAPGANFRGAKLDNVEFDSSNLSNTNFNATVMDHVEFSLCNLDHCSMRDARLTKASLSSTHLNGADLSGISADYTDCFMAHLHHANLDGACLRGAFLVEADLWAAHLKKTNLDFTNLNAARISPANLMNANVRGCVFDKETVKKSGWDHQFLMDLLGREAQIFRLSDFQESIVSHLCGQPASLTLHFDTRILPMSLVDMECHVRKSLPGDASIQLSEIGSDDAAISLRISADTPAHVAAAADALHLEAWARSWSSCTSIFGTQRWRFKMEWSEDSAVDVIRRFTEKYGGMHLREDCYSHLLFSEFRAAFGDRFMTGFAFGATKVLRAQREDLQKPAEHGFKGNASEFYPDLVALPKELTQMGTNRINGIDHISGHPPVALFEWKFLSTFRNMSRNHARLDAKKLQLIGEYLDSEEGTRPLLMQCFFWFKPEGAERCRSRVERWFSERFLGEIPNVRSYFISLDEDQSGVEIHRIGTGA